MAKTSGREDSPERKVSKAETAAEQAPEDGGTGLNRRDFMRLGVTAAATVAAARVLHVGSVGTAGTSHVGSSALPATGIEEATIAELEAAMAAGTLTALSLVQRYLARIEALDVNGPKLNSVLQVNPEAEAIARQLDAERRQGIVRGPLHGIPILVKDNLDTADRLMTAAGSLALVGAAPSQDSTVVAKLRAAGAILLGKTNMNEWAGFRSIHSSSGWSGRAGQCLNPYVLDRNPLGSSSGSAIGASANLCAAAIGTETDGSVVGPASVNGVVGFKPTVGVTSRAGVIPLAHSQDTVGTIGRTVADAATLLGVMACVEPDPRDPATSTGPMGTRGNVYADYTQFLDPDGLRGAKIGIPRAVLFDSFVTEEVDRVFEPAVEAMKAAGATIVDPADIPTFADIAKQEAETAVLLYEFKRDLNDYLATRSNVALDREGFPKSLEGLIYFNEVHADEELKWFGQELFYLSQLGVIDDATYAVAAQAARYLGGPGGIDAVLGEYGLDALASPTATPAWTTDLVNGDHLIFVISPPAAIAGYPMVSVPMGEAFGLPIGMSFYGTAFSEPTLIKVASGFEAVTKARRKPSFLETLPTETSRVHGSARRTRSLPQTSWRSFGLL